MNLLTGTQFIQYSFSEKNYHFNIHSWQNITLTECSGKSELHFHDPVSSITLENCHFDNLIIHNQRMVGRIILKNCSGNLALSNEHKHDLNIEFHGNNKKLNLILDKSNINTVTFEQLITQHCGSLVFQECFFDKVRLFNKNITSLTLHKCEGHLHLKSDKDNLIEKLHIVSQNKFWKKGFVFNIQGYHIEYCDMKTQSFIKDAKQKIKFGNNAINLFNIQDSSFLLPYIPPWFNIILFLLILCIYIYPNNTSHILAKILFISFTVFNAFDYAIKKYHIVTKILIILFCFMWGIYIWSEPHLKFSFYWFTLFNHGMFIFANFVFSLFLIVFYTFSMSVSKIHLIMKENSINKISLKKSIFSFNENQLMQKICAIFLIPLDYLFNGRFFQISLNHNKISQFNINNDGFSDEEKIVIFYEQPEIKISGINFLSLGKESFFYKKMLSFYEKRTNYLNFNNDHIFTLVTKLVYLLLSFTFTSHFIRLKNLVLSIICTVTLGPLLIFTHDNVTIKDNTVQLEILKSDNHLCKTECRHYRNDKKDDKSDIAVPQFYDSYNSWYFTINELISLPLLETNKAFKPNNEHTELFSFIYHCLGLIYTSAFIFHLTKFILFKKAEVDIEEKESD